MKPHLLIISVFIAGVVSLSCTNNGSSPLLGTWMLTSEEVIDCDDSHEMYKENIPCSDSVCFRITFRRDGKMKVDVRMGGATNSWNETYSVVGNKISICDSSGCRAQGSFTISEAQLMLADTLEHGCLKKEYYKKLAAN